MSASDASLRDILSPRKLREIRKKAQRHGAWFKVLSNIERAIITLTIQCVEKVQSAVLAEALTAIIIKLKLAMESKIKRLVRVMGRFLLSKVVKAAKKIGLKRASQWIIDKSFIKYLVITYINTPKMFQIT